MTQNLIDDIPLPGMPEPGSLEPVRDPRLPELKGFTAYSGIEISAIGEEADALIALGHHDPKRMLAALNLHAKSLGWHDLLDGDGAHDPHRWQQALDKLQPRWAVLVTECDDQGMHDDYMGTDGFCPRCRELAEATWWISYSVAESDLGAFPVMVWEA